MTIALENISVLKTSCLEQESTHSDIKILYFLMQTLRCLFVILTIKVGV